MAGLDATGSPAPPFLCSELVRPNSSLGVSRSTGSKTDSWSNDSGAGERFAGSSWDAASDDDDDWVVSKAVSSKQRGYLNFQYREWDSPYDRVPLSKKVAELAQEYPCLMSLRSAELSPSSWMTFKKNHKGIREVQTSD